VHCKALLLELISQAQPVLLVAVKDDNRVVLTGLTYTLNQLLDLRIRIDEALDCDTIQGRLLKESHFVIMTNTHIDAFKSLQQELFEFAGVMGGNNDQLLCIANAVDCGKAAVQHAQAEWGIFEAVVVFVKNDNRLV
jgi:hypothetical protein